MLNASDVYVHGDQHLLFQAIANLLDNAVKYTPELGHISATLEHHQGNARVTVSDSGPGIPEDFQDSIFHIFSQADITDERKESGTGMGLNISKAIINHHGGEIGFETEQGVGTTFYFTLPAL